MLQFEVRMRATRRAETTFDRSLDHERCVGTTWRLRHKLTNEQRFGHSETGLSTSDGLAKAKPMIEGDAEVAFRSGLGAMLSAGIVFGDISSNDDATIVALETSPMRSFAGWCREGYSRSDDNQSVGNWESILSSWTLLLDSPSWT